MIPSTFQKMVDDLENLKGRTASVEVACTYLIENVVEQEDIENELKPLFQAVLTNMGLSSRATSGFHDGVEVLMKGTKSSL